MLGEFLFPDATRSRASYERLLEVTHEISKVLLYIISQVVVL